MRVAIACPYAWDAPGGVQVHIGQLARHLRARGHEVVVLAPARGRPEDIVKVGRPVAIRYQGTVAPICFSVGSSRRIKVALAAFRPDVVHAHEPLVPSTGMLAALRATAPVVATFHAFAERSRALTVAAPALRPVWRRLSVRIAVSAAAARFVGSRFRGDVHVVPNGCDVDLFADATPIEGLPPGRRILWVGRLDPQKGFGIALSALEILLARDPHALLVVVGDGRDRSLMDRMRPGARARVHLVGAMPHERLPGYHAASEVFVAPAIGQESFGIVLVEAMAAGLPVIASDIDGYREVVRDGVEGLLVPPGDPNALGDALGRVLADPALAHRLAGAGRERARRYRWDAVVGEVEQAYADAMARSSESGGPSKMG